MHLKLSQVPEAIQSVVLLLMSLDLPRGGNCECRLSQWTSLIAGPSARSIYFSYKVGLKILSTSWAVVLNELITMRSAAEWPIHSHPPVHVSVLIITILIIYIRSCRGMG